jgi:arylsulfatase A-like enzyme
VTSASSASDPRDSDDRSPEHRKGDRTDVTSLRRAAVLGLAFGLAVTAFDTWFSARRFMGMRIPALLVTQSKAAVLEIGLGLVLGLAVTPLATFGRGVWALLAIAAVWTLLARIVAPDPTLLPMWLMPTGAGLALVAMGWLLARRWPRLPWTLGVIGLAAALVTPSIVEWVRTRNDPQLPPLAAPKPDAPDVVLVVLDTVRAQSTSAYGYGRPTTPTLEALAKDGALFLDATSPSTWSLPSHGSLFTGWFPSAHRTDGDHRHLDATPPTLADVLARAGYETRCFTANPHISDGFGLTRGFRHSDRAYLDGRGGRSFSFVYRVLDLVGVSADDKGGGDVATHVEDWMASRPAGDRPAFVFINFLEAHFPYHQVPPEFLAKFTTRSRAELRTVSLEAFGAQFGRTLTPAEIAAATPPSIDMYDAGVLYSDHLLSRVVEALRKSGRLDRTILVVLADHGELVGEHGNFGHGMALYEVGVRVPLLVRYPPRVPAGARVAAPVSTLGVFATILDLVGIEPPVPVHVGSLLPAITGGDAGLPVIVERSASDLSTTETPDPLAKPDRRYRTYRSNGLKLVETSKGDTLLFDLAADPQEERDVAKSRPADLARMKAELASWAERFHLPAIDAMDAGAAPPVELDPATRERLKALGYAD